MIIHSVIRSIRKLGRVAVAVAGDDGRVLAIGFTDHRDALDLHWWLARGAQMNASAHSAHDDLFARLQHFAAGNSVPAPLSAIAHLPEFSRNVLTATAAIPFGETATYAQIAARIGRPRAARAVGQALGRNPVPILIPCHRVLGSGHIGGFTPGLAIKRRLLEIEGHGPGVTCGS